jgi:predicted PurR-regulated permease PerM
MENQKITYEISIWSVLRIIALFIGLWLLYLIRDVLIILLVVMIISVALEPYVLRLEKDKIPRGVSVIVLYLTLLIVLGLAIYFIVPPVATQIKELTINLPYYTQRATEINLGNTGAISTLLDSLSQRLSDLAGGVLSTVIAVFGGIVYAITIFALTFYALVDGARLRRSLASLIPVEQKERLYTTINKVSEKLGDWLRGQLILMLTIGVLDGGILGILGIKYALTLGLLAGLLEIIPVIGPIIAAVTAVLVAFISGTAIWKIAAIVVAYVLIQQLEGNILVPKIMSKVIGLSPIFVIIAILIGNRLLGLGGAMLAVPVAAGIQVFVLEYWPIKRS